MEQRPIRFLSPLLPDVDAIAEKFRAATQRRWYSNEGPCWHEFAERLEGWLLGDLRCVPLANATLALTLALRCLAKPGRGTEVLLPSFTFAASASAVVWAGLVPVFLDVDPEGWHLDQDELARALDERGSRVAAVMACSTFGMPPRPEQSMAWSEITRSHGVPLLVDSAAGFGSQDRNGAWLGGQGDAEVFSFHATKPFAIGEGGMLATKDAELVTRIRAMANFGLMDGIVSAEPGLNAKLAEWPSATGLAVLDGFAEVLQFRRAAARQMTSALEALGLAFQPESADASWHFVPALARSETSRDAVRGRAREAGIEFRAYYDVPLHRMPAFKSADRVGDLKVTEELAARALSLPMANDQSDSDRERIINAVRSAV